MSLTSLSKTRSRFLPPLAAVSGLVLLVGCSATSPATEKSAQGAKGSCSQQSEPFSTDDAEGAADYKDVVAELGEVEKPSGDVKIGSVMKFLGNQYWASLSKGQTSRADKYGVKIDVQAAASESDPVGQLNSARDHAPARATSVMLASPQTDTNLCPAVEKAEASDVLVMNVNDAVLPQRPATGWVPTRSRTASAPRSTWSRSAGRGVQSPSSRVRPGSTQPVSGPRASPTRPRRVA